MARRGFPEEVPITRELIGTLELPLEQLRSFENTTGAVRLYYDHGLGMKVVGKRVDTLGRPLADRLTEAHLQARFRDHPNLADVLAAPEVEGGSEDKLMRPVIEIITPYYEQGSLHDRVVHDRSSLPIHEALAIAAATARGLAELHANRIVHRDVKSTNVFLTGDHYVAVVGDLGEAAQLDAQGVADGIEIIHPWAAPENWSVRQVSTSCDMYGFGVCLVEMLRGDLNYENYSSLEGRARLTQGRRALRDRDLELPPTVPRRLRRLISRLLRRDPDGRPSAHSVLDELAGVFALDWVQTDDDDGFARWEAPPGPGCAFTYVVEAEYRPRLKAWDVRGVRLRGGGLPRQRADAVRVDTLSRTSIQRVFDQLVEDAQRETR